LYSYFIYSKDNLKQVKDKEKDRFSLPFTRSVVTSLISIRLLGTYTKDFANTFNSFSRRNKLNAEYNLSRVILRIILLVKKHIK